MHPSLTPPSIYQLRIVLRGISPLIIANWICDIRLEAILLLEPKRGDPVCIDGKRAALVSYGLTVKLLHDVLPLDEPLQAVTIRNHVFTLPERLENALGDEQWSFIDSCPWDWATLPILMAPSPSGSTGAI